MGSRYDPATSLRNAEEPAGQLPDAGLLVVDEWGHRVAPAAQRVCRRHRHRLPARRHGRGEHLVRDR
ncbi:MULTISPECIES: alpha/beta hydrolase [Pseudonocardia]|uniref:alpha/beta hydrolase n=1 Tax=Pseudonocardia TaxID=1847 RepID=UPI0013020FE9